jgi:uncharacterized coiled-coil protein SlyX
MPPAVTQSAIIRALNSTFATALTRSIVIGLPVIAGLALWGAERYLAEKVDEAPVVQELQAERDAVRAILDRQDERLRTLEEGRRANAALIASAADIAAKQSAKLDRIDNQLNRMVGAFEARGLIPRQPQPLSDP